MFSSFRKAETLLMLVRKRHVYRMNLQSHFIQTCISLRIPWALLQQEHGDELCDANRHALCIHPFYYAVMLLRIEKMPRIRAATEEQPSTSTSRPNWSDEL